MTESFPRSEQFGLTSQLRRSAASIPSLIAEGCGRGSDQDFARFLQMAMGSAAEAEYQLLLSHELNYLDSAKYEELEICVTEIKRMLATFLARLRNSAAPNGRASLKAES